MRQISLVIFIIPLCLRIGIIFFDWVKSTNNFNESITIYENNMHWSSTIEANVTDLEQQLASAYEIHDSNIKIDDKYLIKNDTTPVFTVPEKEIKTDLEKEKEKEREFLLQYLEYKKNKEDWFENSNANTEINNNIQIVEAPKQTENLLQIPKSYDLPNVIFYSQAPYWNRNEPYQNACEEASILLAYYYIKNKRPSKSEYKTDLLNLMAREQNNLWHHKDTTIEEFLYLIKNFLEVDKSYLIVNPTVEQIKTEISKWNIIIAPFRGKELKNPHYSLGGPYYHVMVIKGYDENNFITHDVWTSRWENRKYSIDTIMSALANWDKKRLDEEWTKIIVLEK